MRAVLAMCVAVLGVAPAGAQDWQQLATDKKAEADASEYIASGWYAGDTVRLADATGYRNAMVFAFNGHVRGLTIPEAEYDWAENELAFVLANLAGAEEDLESGSLQYTRDCAAEEIAFGDFMYGEGAESYALGGLHYYAAYMEFWAADDAYVAAQGWLVESSNHLALAETSLAAIDALFLEYPPPQ